MRIYKVDSQMDIYKTQSAPQTKKVNNKARDQVSVSDVAREFQVAYKAVKDVPDIRSEKVEDIKQRINSGTYNVTAREVSEKIAAQLDLRG